MLPWTYPVLGSHIGKRGWGMYEASKETWTALFPQVWKNRGHDCGIFLTQSASGTVGIWTRAQVSVVTAVVLGLKDLSQAWLSFRAADKGKTDWNDCISCWMVPFDSTHSSWCFILNRHLWGILLLVGHTIIRKKQAAGWLLKRYEEVQRAETEERISEEAPGGPPRDPDDYCTTTASVILHTLRHTVERNSQT